MSLRRPYSLRTDPLPHYYQDGLLIEEDTRSLLDILQAEEEYFDPIWYARNVARPGQKPRRGECREKGRRTAREKVRPRETAAGRWLGVRLLERQSGSTTMGPGK